MKKKILILHHGSGLGGGLIALLGLIDELKEDYDVSVFCIFKSDAIDYLKARDIEVYTPKKETFYSKYNLYIHSEASFNNIPSFIKFFYYFILSFLNSVIFSKSELKVFSDKFDIFYLNSLFVSDWLLYSKKYFKNVVVHVREPLAKGIFGFRKNIFRCLLKKYSDLIICVSEDNKTRVNIPDKSIRVYDPVVLLGRADPNFEVFKEPNKKYFTYLGGSQRIKGFEQFVNSLEYLEDDIKIFFLGGLTELEENTQTFSFKIRSLFSKYTRKKLKELRIKFYKSNKIEFIGKTDNVFNYYEESVAIICPFAKPHACLPILEAYSVGKPVIVSNVEGMDEHFSNKIMEVFKNHNSKELADKINIMARFKEEELLDISRLAKERYNKIKFSNPSINALLKNL